MKPQNSRFSSAEHIRDGFENCTKFHKPRHLPSQDNDIPNQSADTAAMTDITREELDSKLSETNLKVDLRLSQFENTVRETLSAIRQDSSDARREMGELRGDIGSQLGQFRGEMSIVSGELKAVHVEMANLKNLRATIITSTLAILLSGIGGYFAIKNDGQMVVSNALSSFSVGRDVGTGQAAVAEQLKEIERFQLELAKQAEDTRLLLEKAKEVHITQPPNPAGGN